MMQMCTLMLTQALMLMQMLMWMLTRMSEVMLMLAMTWAVLTMVMDMKIVMFGGGFDGDDDEGAIDP